MSDLLNSASLVMIPSGYKEDTVYSVVPSDGSGDLSFTRASNGTRVNSAGLVEVCPWNLLEYSEELNNAYWQKNLVTINPNTTVAPNGTTTADTFTNSSTGYGIYAVVNVAPSQQYTFSFYIKKGTNTSYILSVIDAVSFNSISSLDYSSQVSATDWVRITRTFTTPSTTTSIRVYQMRDGSTTGTAFLWGAQLNIGSTAKPYFPTTDRLNVPRLTYQNGGGGCPSLLLEKQSTNLALYSQEFDNGYWGKPNVTITANNTTSPDGTQNADKLASNGAGNDEYIERSGFTTSVGTYTSSIFMKNVDATTSVLMAVHLGEGSQTSDMRYTWSTNTFTTNGTNVVSAKATNYGNGWVRLEFTYTIGASVTGHWYRIYAQTATSTKAIYIWGAQLEASSYPTSYIPTTSSSATRVADACFKTGISSLIGGGVGTWFMDFEMVQGGGLGNPFAFDLSDGTTSNRLYLYWGESVQSWYWGGADTAITLPSTLRKKVAIKFSGTTAKLFCNGSSIATNTIATAFSRLDIGQRFSNTFPMDGKINQAYFLTTSLTDAECQAITTI